MFCGYCGNKIKDGYKFCTKCGKPAEEDDETPIQSTTNTTTKFQRYEPATQKPIAVETPVPKKDYSKEFAYKRNHDGGITIESYIGDDDVVDIPREIDGKIVNCIGSNAFRMNPFSPFSATTVIIPDSVTSIKSEAFNHSNIQSIVIPNSVTSIGSWAFSHCSGLTSITIPPSVTHIGAWIFDDCYNLEEIIFKGRTNLDGIDIDKHWLTDCRHGEIFFEP